jgi:hypothetical protein
MIYENPAFPSDLKEEIYRALRKLCADERKPTETEAQFLYKTRKKAFGPFKRKFWDLPSEVRAAIGKDLEKKFGFLFEQLNLQRTAELVKKAVPLVSVIPPAPPALAEALATLGTARG